jgi:N-methylhydantoinase B
MSIDPITIEVVTSRLREIAAGMEHALYHAGFSPILRESRDGTAGLTDAQGRVLMVGGGLQYHSLPYEQAVRAVVAHFRERIRDGDSFIVNDPYVAGNPHVPDMVAVTPAFHDGALIGFGVSIAHKADVGGLVPGSSGAGSREIFHDGLRLPPVRFQTAAGIQRDIEEVLRANSRTPDVVIGDTRGQVGATRLGAARLAALAAEYGRACVAGVMEEILERTARRIGAELAAWPDGEAEAEGFLDNDGAELDRPVRIAVRAHKTGDRLILDLGGCAPQTRGPVNVNAWTARSVSLLAVLAASDPTIPLNSGLLRAVDFVIPEGLVVNPRYPATINLYFPTSVMIYTCVLSALGKLNPARAVAPSGLVTGAVSFGYRNRAKPLVQYELAATGLGGTSAHDGTPIVHPMNHFTAGSPVEVVESEYPVLVRRYDIWTDSAGAGRTRGGIGYVRELQVQEDCLLTLRSSGHRSAAWGLAGGEGPAVSRTTVNPGTADEQKLAAIDTRELKAGDVLRIERSGGAGCGPARKRDPDAVRRDVEDGYVSVAAAREQYGVVIDP